MKRLRSLLSFLDRAGLLAGKLFSFLIFVVMVIIVFEVISRWLFNSPTEWVHEASTMCYGIFFIMGGGYAFIKGEHVRMDVFYSRLSEKGKAIIDIATFIFLISYPLVIIWYGGKTAYHSFMINEHTQTVWGPPIYPSKMILVIGTLLVFVAGCTKFVRDILIVVTGKEITKL